MTEKTTEQEALNQANSPETQKSEPTAEQIFQVATATKRWAFEIEGAGWVWVYRLGHHEAKLLSDAMSRDDKGKLADEYCDAKIIARCVRGSDGKPKFQESDIPRIHTMGNDIFLALVDACLTINGIGVVGSQAIAKNLLTPGNDF